MHYILIADDDKELCETLADCIRMQLDNKNLYEIIYAHTPIEVEEQLQNYNVSLCLLDLLFEGFGMVDPIGLASRYPDTYFVIISAYLDTLKPDNLMFFISKPLVFDKIIKVLGLVLNNEPPTPLSVQ